MVISTAIEIARKPGPALVPTKPRVSMVRHSDSNAREHQELVEYRHRNNVLKVDLDAATTALSLANDAARSLGAENDALRARVKELEMECASLRTAAKAKSEKRGKKTAVAAAPAPESGNGL